ncbi:PREDICTED: uncharacterized protein LOC109468270 [Branchiostoma belcheri]|uniref:E3 ubiquitin ligase TRAF3IP2 n=1 Tax=Branchiostoma belcheri TaxID=7741 RepID=A0A6P4XZM3_BRABE|nr:PREDICTED: uncharacterized protein LOC109468270 [Branchiostoma belcheri]
MADQHHLSQLKLPYLKRLAEKLDPKTTIGHDWRDVADGLGFSMDSIRHVESTSQGSSPTIQVLNLCSHKAGFTVGRLREVFHSVERHDCICILDEAAEEVETARRRRPVVISPSAVEHDDRFHPVSLTSGEQVSLAQSQNSSLRSEPVENEDMPEDSQSLNSRPAQEDVWVRQQPALDRSWQHIQQGADSNIPFSSAAMSASQNHSVNSCTSGIAVSGLSARGPNRDAASMDRSVTSGMLTLNIAGHESTDTSCGGQRSNAEASALTNGESAGPRMPFSDKGEQCSTSFDYGTEGAPSPSYPYSPSSHGDQELSEDILTSAETQPNNLPPIRTFMPDDNPRTLTSNDFFPYPAQYQNGQNYNMGPPQYNHPGMNGQQNPWVNGAASPRAAYVGPRGPYPGGMGVPQYKGAAGGGRGHPYVPHDQPMRVPHQHPSQPLMNGPYRPNAPPYQMYNNGYPPPPHGPPNTMSQKQQAQNAATGPSSESGVSSAPDSFHFSGSNTGTSRNETTPPPQMVRAMSMPPNAAPGAMIGAVGGAVQNGVPAAACTRSLSVNNPPTTPDTVPATAERIFITYSKDNEIHLVRVLDMAKKLFAEGFFVEVDMFARHFAGIDKMGWLDNRIKKAAFVIIICSPQYMVDVEKKSESVDGLHTLYIHRSLQTEYLDNKACNYRFIPILFDGFSRDCVPRWLHNTTIFYWPKDIQDIMARLRRRERFPTPAIGKPPCIRRNPDHT